MKTKIYELNAAGVRELESMQTSKMLKNEKSLYLIDIHAEKRESAFATLESYNIRPDIIEALHRPAEHIRFEYFENTLYGELAYFSLKSRKPSYAGIINMQNIVLTVHEFDEGLMSEILKSIFSFNRKQLDRLNVEYLLYIFTIEILSKYGSRVLHYREQVEELALDFDNKHTEISPDDFLEAKSQLSNFSRVLEKLFYTLSFPPTRDFLDKDNLYRTYFKDLQKNLDLVTHSLTQTEERLNSLNDHYQLLLQDKSNKRLNFLTIIQAVFVPLTLIAGIYGMNFKYMPLLEYRYGYFLSLGIMGISAIVFLWYFFKRGWFER